MNKIYVGWHEGGYGASGFVDHASLNKFELVKKLLKDLSQPDSILVFDSETMEELEECNCLNMYCDKHWCGCSECKDNDETVRYLSENKLGNYSR